MVAKEKVVNMATYGVYSEVGKLRKVMVHRPELSLKRLTPTNVHDLLFDDVVWVKKACWEHDVFVDHMRSRGIEVLLVRRLRCRARKSGRGCQTDASPIGWIRTCGGILFLSESSLDARMMSGMGLTARF
jgi:Arginine deiminase